MEIRIPKNNADLASTLPDGIALPEVRTILGSMSLSYHMLIAFEPPADNVPPINVINEVQSVSDHDRSMLIKSYRASESWTRIAHIAVICNNTMTLNFINLMRREANDGWSSVIHLTNYIGFPEVGQPEHHQGYSCCNERRNTKHKMEQ